jgi:hypothetical protein
MKRSVFELTLLDGVTVVWPGPRDPLIGIVALRRDEDTNTGRDDRISVSAT